MDIAVGVLSGIIAILVGVVWILRESLQKNKQYTHQLLDRIANLEFQYAENAKKSLTTQRSVIKGQLAEQLYPLSVDCPYTLSDMKFIGMPIDYIIFDGYTLCKDGEGEIKEIIFADIKTGKATLSAHQRAIRDAVNSGRVRWETINL